MEIQVHTGQREGGRCENFCGSFPHYYCLRASAHLPLAQTFRYHNRRRDFLSAVCWRTDGHMHGGNQRFVRLHDGRGVKYLHDPYRNFGGHIRIGPRDMHGPMFRKL